MGSVSEIAKKARQVQALAAAEDLEISQQHQDQFLEQVTVMQGSIWEYSDSQPWFIVGLHKNNPTATRQALESIMKYNPQPRSLAPEKRRGGVNIKDGKERERNCDSQGHVQRPSLQGEAGDTHKSSEDMEPTENKSETDITPEWKSTSKRFSGPPEMKIVIKKTVELVHDMAKSCELVFHATRAVTRFLTYPTPSIPSDNFVFGHAKGWLWLIYKGLSHFNPDNADKVELDAYMKTFRREMSLLAKETKGCIKELEEYMDQLRKLNTAIKKEAKFLKRHRIWLGPMTHYFRFLDEIKTKHQVLVDVKEDRFFPTDWIFEPHPSQTKFEWDFFHFQWIDLRRDWIDCEFEVRSDYSMHWSTYSSFSPELQTEIVVHLIQHLKAMIEECRQFHRINMRLSFDYQEIKFLHFAVEEIYKIKGHKEAIEFITSITKKLYEDLAMLHKVSEEYMTHMEWLGEIIEPCYRTMNRWLADDLILPLDFSARKRPQQKWLCNCHCFRRRKDFLEMFGEPLKVVLLRSPISTEQLRRFFPVEGRILDDEIPPPCPINSFGVSRGYTSSIFDTGLGRERPLPIHHPLPKYKKRQEQKYNIFSIHRLIETTADCIIELNGGDGDVDIEKYLLVMEELQRFLAVFGTIFTSVMADVKERVGNMEALMYNNLPEHYETLDRMIEYEQSNQRESSEKSGTKAILRLHKIFQFVVYFVKKSINLEETEGTFYICKSAYYKSYAKFHGWIYQKAVTLSMYSLPTKGEMFSSLFAEIEKPELDVKINEFVEQAYKLIDICENIFKLRNLADKSS